jgi:hypothetical protein
MKKNDEAAAWRNEIAGFVDGRAAVVVRDSQGIISSPGAREVPTRIGISTSSVRLAISLSRKGG